MGKKLVIIGSDFSVNCIEDGVLPWTLNISRGMAYTPTAGGIIAGKKSSPTRSASDHAELSSISPYTKLFIPEGYAAAKVQLDTLQQTSAFDDSGWIYVAGENDVTYTLKRYVIFTIKKTNNGNFTAADDAALAAIKLTIPEE